MIAGSIAVQTMAWTVRESSWWENPLGPLLVLVLAVLGIVLFIAGCSAYAKGKGHDRPVPLLVLCLANAIGLAIGHLGPLNILGLVILVCLPDKHKT